jgi:hypothetical protein
MGDTHGLDDGRRDTTQRRTVLFIAVGVLVAGWLVNTTAGDGPDSEWEGIGRAEAVRACNNFQYLANNPDTATLDDLDRAVKAATKARKADDRWTRLAAAGYDMQTAMAARRMVDVVDAATVIEDECNRL